MAHPVTRLISTSAWALVEPRFSQFAKDTLAKLITFVEEECIPAESIFHDQIAADRWSSYPKVIEDLKARAKVLGLWNLFLSKEHYPDVGVPLTNLEYAIMAEVMGRSPRIAPEACNCSAPDTGNMETIARYGNDAQKKKWLTPLLEGKTRSSFAMTERGIASSDATNIRTTIRQEGNELVISGHKWWISGAGDPRNAIHIVMGKSDLSAPKHKQQSIVLVPANAPGVKLIRGMTCFQYDDAPEGHFEVIYDNVRVPIENLLGDFGDGFSIIQGRLGPGRIHHCMRLLGMAERSLDLMLIRASEPSKVAFGKLLQEHGTVIAGIAQSRIEIDSARLIVLSAALQIDLVRAKGALKDIGIAKALVPKLVEGCIDRAIQVHGAEGICQDTPLASFWSNARWLRFADGPDEVHIQQIGKNELKRAASLHKEAAAAAERQRLARAKAGLKALL